MFRSLRYRNARLFFAGLAISNVGTWLQLTAMSLLVYRITDGDALIVGINAGLQFLPMLFLGAWAGAVADGAQPAADVDHHPVGAGGRRRSCWACSI